MAETALNGNLTPEQIVKEAFIPAMETVGQRFQDGEVFVPEMLMSAHTMREGLNVVKPWIVGGRMEHAGKVVLGTVRDDLHGIGKNLVGMMLEGTGFEVIDLGTNVSPERFVAAVDTHKPDLLGLSALLATTMNNIPAVVEAVNRSGMRDIVKIIVGGAPLNEKYALTCGADACAPDAGAAVAVAKGLLGLAGLSH